MEQMYSVLDALFEQLNVAREAVANAREMEEGERIVSLREGTVTGLGRAIRCVMRHMDVKIERRVVDLERGTALYAIEEQGRTTGQISAKNNWYTATYHGFRSFYPDETYREVVSEGPTEDEAFYRARQKFLFNKVDV